MKKLVIQDMVQEKSRELDSLLTNKPKLNIIDYDEAMMTKESMYQEVDNE